MSNLESKVKTTYEILSCVHDASGFIGLTPNQGAKVTEYGRKLWVPLEIAQKLEKENEKLEDENTQLKEADYDSTYQVAFLKEDLADQKNRIVKVNRLLDKNQADIIPDKSLIKYLREVLSEAT